MKRLEVVVICGHEFFLPGLPALVVAEQSAPTATETGVLPGAGRSGP